MPIRFRCKQCRQVLSVSRRQSGREVTCPACGQQIRVPEIESAQSPGESVASDSVSSATPQRPPGEAAAAERPLVPMPTIPAGDAEEEGFALRSASTQFEDMDLTPMVDVTFLLLIFFMVTASFSVQKSIEVPTPDPEQEGATATVVVEDVLEKSLRITIDERNTVYVEDEAVADVAQLSDALRDASRSAEKTDVVIIPDPGSFHETVVQVIDAANDAGMQNIRLAGGGPAE